MSLDNIGESEVSDELKSKWTQVRTRLVDTWHCLANLINHLLVSLSHIGMYNIVSLSHTGMYNCYHNM